MFSVLYLTRPPLWGRKYSSERLKMSLSYQRTLRVLFQQPNVPASKALRRVDTDPEPPVGVVIVEKGILRISSTPKHFRGAQWGSDPASGNCPKASGNETTPMHVLDNRSASRRMKAIHLYTLLISFIAVAVATPLLSLDSRVSTHNSGVPICIGCSLTFVCDGGALQVAHCEKQGYGCPDTGSAANSTCAADCGCLISCTVGP
ncbi:hypothetical protein DFH06DRAFT_1125281 [Mycena polygramma]|nr:hypothetical protein DFH06DRAFT_1125281 [Mycena polygramma]